MKWILALLLLPCTLSAKTYYFSSSSGNDSRTAAQAQDPGTPWQTISKAVSSMGIFVAGDSLVFKRGDTFTGNRLTFGKAGLIVSAYGTGVQPIFSGFMTPTWTSIGGNKYTATIPGTNAVKLVVRNGVPLQSARYPNSGWLTATAHSGNAQITVPALASAPSVLGSFQKFRIRHDQITNDSVTSQAGTVVNFAATSGYAILQDNNGVFYQGLATFLDTAGEFHFAKAGRLLTIYSTTTPTGIQVSTQDTLIDVRQYANTTIDNIDLEGANWNGLTFGGPSVGQATRTTIKNCTFNLMGNDAIYGSRNDNALITGNTITNVLSNGIELENEGGRSQFATVTYNRIKKCGMIPGMATGVAQKHNGIVVWGDNATIEYNDIDSVGLTGISIYYNDVSVSYNRINHFCMTVDDAGAINVFDPSFGVTQEVRRYIRYNTIMNGTFTVGVGTFDGESTVNGIYTDDFSNGVIIEYNSIYNIPRSAFYIHNSTDISFRNNTTYLGDQNQFEIAHDNNTVGVPIRRILISKNIFWSGALGTNKYSTIRTVRPFADIDSMGVIDSNYYARPLVNLGNTHTTRTIPNGRDSAMTYAVWRQRHPSKDANSTVKATNLTGTVRVYFNWADTPRTVFLLDSVKYDAKGTRYTGNFTVSRFGPMVVLQDSGFLANTPPDATAMASPATITLPVNTVSLIGNATDNVGVSSVFWYKASGPFAVINNGGTYNATASSLTQGLYQFGFVAQDAEGLRDTAFATVTVNAAVQPNQPPTVIAAPSDTTITQPAASINARSYGSDPEGAALNTQWTRLSGTGTAASPTSPFTALNGLSLGDNVWQVAVTDTGGLSAISNITIHVNAAPINQPPKADAGPDTTFQLPGTLVVVGTGTDPEGGALTYKWFEGASQLSSSATLTVLNPAAGPHTYRLDVSDGVSTASASVVITVLAMPASAPVILFLWPGH